MSTQDLQKWWQWYTVLKDWFPSVVNVSQTDVVKHPVLACRDIGFELSKEEEEILTRKMLNWIVWHVTAKVKA